MSNLIHLIFLVTCLTITTRCDADQQEELPKLEDILPSLHRRSDVNSNATSALNNIDLEKINLPKFKVKINSLRNDFRTINASRRQANIPVIRGSYMAGTDQRTRRKICDLMLQTIFMARHKIKEMQGSKYFSVTDTAYRIAYLARRLEAMMKKLLEIYWTMVKHQEEWQDITPLLILHHKAMRWHIDYKDLWWILVRLDGAYKDRTRPQESDDEDDPPTP